MIKMIIGLMCLGLMACGAGNDTVVDPMGSAGAPVMAAGGSIDVAGAPAMVSAAGAAVVAAGGSVDVGGAGAGGAGAGGAVNIGGSAGAAVTLPPLPTMIGDNPIGPGNPMVYPVTCLVGQTSITVDFLYSGITNAQLDQCPAGNSSCFTVGVLDLSPPLPQSPTSATYTLLASDVCVNGFLRNASGAGYLIATW